MLRLFDICIQWLLFVSVALFFVSLPMTNTALAWRLRRWSAAIFLGVLLFAIVVVESRVHPLMSCTVAMAAMSMAYGVLEFRKYLHRRKPEPTPDFLNLRSTGKRPVDLDDHPDAFEPRDDAHDGDER